MRRRSCSRHGAGVPIAASSSAFARDQPVAGRPESVKIRSVPSITGTVVMISRAKGGKVSEWVVIFRARAGNGPNSVAQLAAASAHHFVEPRSGQQ